LVQGWSRISIRAIAKLASPASFKVLHSRQAFQGDGWLPSSLAGNNYPTTSSLRDNLWETAFQNSLLIPGNSEQDAAGYPPTLTDPWGQLLSYQLLYGPDGGVSGSLSGITTLSNFAV
jgi:lysophospholipase